MIKSVSAVNGTCATAVRKAKPRVVFVMDVTARVSNVDNAEAVEAAGMEVEGDVTFEITNELDDFCLSSNLIKGRAVRSGPCSIAVPETGCGVDSPRATVGGGVPYVVMPWLFQRQMW